MYGFVRLVYMISSGQSKNDCLHSGKAWHVVAIQFTKPPLSQSDTGCLEVSWRAASL